MKIIYVKKVKANQEIEKSEGIYDKAREVLPDNETQRVFIEKTQEQEEIEEAQKEMHEQELAEKYMANPEQYEEVNIQEPVQEPVQETGVVDNTNMSKIMDHLNSKTDMVIDYITNSGYDIIRTVTPEKIFRAPTTGNNILLTRTQEWGGDYRAYIINNIQSIESADQTEYYL